MMSLHLRMTLLLAAFFALIYAVVVMIGTSMGTGSFTAYLAIAGAMMFFQYMIGPKVVEWSMRVRYINRDDAPQLYDMITDAAQRAQIPIPRVCISELNIPNAFAFGRSVRDGRVCVTRGILRLLNEDELRAVIGHEVGHLRNRDVLTITLLSVIPLVLYHVAWQLIFAGGRRDDRGGGGTVLIGLAAFFFYFLSNLLVLYASRIREYFADKASLEFGNRPEALASALYKLVYGSARMKEEELREAEGLKAFFLNDPTRAMNEFKDLRDLDLDRNGRIDADELLRIKDKYVSLGTQHKLMEILSTHPNMLKRVKELSASI